jgi:hypothetical protein
MFMLLLQNKRIILCPIVNLDYYCESIPSPIPEMFPLYQKQLDKMRQLWRTDGLEL